MTDDYNKLSVKQPSLVDSVIVRLLYVMFFISWVSLSLALNRAM